MVDRVSQSWPVLDITKADGDDEQTKPAFPSPGDAIIAVADSGHAQIVMMLTQEPWMEWLLN